MEQHLPQLIHDLAIILMAAGTITILFKRLRQPVVLGYIISGLLVGPHIQFLPTVLDLPSIKVWSEIGVIFLLFALGLEFSFKKLFRVGGAASITAIVEIVAMIGIGYVTGRAFGWSQMDCIFLGGILAISSTTIIIRAFDEAGVKGRKFVSLVFGVLIVEDLVAILLLVLLSTLAASRQFQGTEMIMSVVKLFFFLTLWFLSGIFLVPTLLRKAKPFLNQETLLVVSIGMCFLMVVLASKAGFSPALGAFIMGSIFAETTDAEKIEHLVSPVKDLFAAIFFVSVGTLIDPALLSQYAVPVLTITAVTVIGKTLSTLLGALVSGQSLRHSVQSGFSLAQIGEFSFIIAGLGLSLNVTSEFLYPVAVGVSALTTFTTPYMIKSADRGFALIERSLPQRWKTSLSSYSLATQGVASTSQWRELLRAYVTRVLINAVIVTAIFLSIARFATAYLSGQLASSQIVNGLSLVLALVLSAPFLWAWLMSQPAKHQAAELWESRRYRAPLIAMEAFRVGSAIALFAFLAPQIVAVRVALGMTLLAMAVILILFSRYWSAVYDWFEGRFVSNLSARDESREAELPPPIVPWDAHIAKLQIPAHSELVGKTLMECKIRETFGVTIALIERGGRVITAPTRGEHLYPHDVLSAIGTDEQIERFQRAIQTTVPEDQPAKSKNYSLHQVTIATHSPYVLRTIRDSGIRELTNGLVVGLERHGQRILNPDSATRIEPGDRLWIVGDTTKMKELTSADHRP